MLIVGILGYFVIANVTKDEKANNQTNNTREESNYNTNDAEEDETNDLAGSYSSLEGDNIAKDAEEAVTGKEDIELTLGNDGSAKVGLKDEEKDGTYTQTGSTVTAVVTDKANNKDTYEFTINDDDSLTYTDGNGKNITLKKVDSSKLKFIK